MKTRLTILLIILLLISSVYVFCGIKSYPHSNIKLKNDDIVLLNKFNKYCKIEIVSQLDDPSDIGLYDGKIYIKVEFKRYNSNDFKLTLFHEFCHFLTDNNTVIHKDITIIEDNKYITICSCEVLATEVEKAVFKKIYKVNNKDPNAYYTLIGAKRYEFIKEQYKEDIIKYTNKIIEVVK